MAISVGHQCMNWQKADNTRGIICQGCLIEHQGALPRFQTGTKGGLYCGGFPSKDRPTNKVWSICFLVLWRRAWRIIGKVGACDGPAIRLSAALCHHYLWREHHIIEGRRIQAVTSALNATNGDCILKKVDLEEQYLLKYMQIEDSSRMRWPIRSNALEDPQR